MTQASKFDLPPAGTGFNRRFIVLKYPLDALETVVAATFAVPVIDLRAGSRGSAAVAFARQSAMYLAHIAFGLSYAEVGRMFGRDRTTAAYACRLVEERRDDPLVDAVLSALENTCAVAAYAVLDDRVRA